VPMVLAGDEIGRSQAGNNNAYCQDNETSWVDWELDERAQELLAFTKRLIALRREHPIFRRPTFLTGKEQEDSGAPDIWWFRPDGRAMTRRDWDRGDASAVGAFLNGAEIMAETREGESIIDDSFLVLFNAWQDALSFRLPPARFGRRWSVELSTADPGLEAGAWDLPVRGEVEVEGRSLLLLRRSE
jgi:isoamylase